MTASVETQETSKTSHYPMYKVIMHNDNTTTFEFVIYVLTTIFGKESNEAAQLTQQIHDTGFAIAGIYALEHAELKCDQTHSMARARNFPLTCTLEAA